MLYTVRMQSDRDYDRSLRLFLRGCSGSSTIFCRVARESRPADLRRGAGSSASAVDVSPGGFAAAALATRVGALAFAARGGALYAPAGITTLRLRSTLVCPASPDGATASRGASWASSEGAFRFRGFLATPLARVAAADLEGRDDADSPAKTSGGA